MEVHVFNPRTWEVVAGALLIPGQTGSHRQTGYQNKGWGGCSVAELLPSICESLGLIFNPHHHKRKKKMTVIFNMKKNSIINLNFLSYKLAQNSCKF
jgi:hypothetical protein